MLVDSAVIAGRSAAYLSGVDHAAAFGDPVQVIIPPGAPRPRGHMVVHRTDIASHDVVEMPWCRCTVPVRTAWDLAAWHDVVSSVTIVDTMLRQGTVSPAALHRMVGPSGIRAGRRPRPVPPRVTDAGAPGAGRAARPRTAVCGPA